MKLKKTIDSIMIILLFLLMPYFLMEQMIHEVLGLLMLLFFVLHQFVNRPWYQTLNKPKVTLLQKTNGIVNTCLFVVMVLLIISGISMSSLLPTFHFMPLTLARKIHMLAAYWGFIGIALHLGMHISTSVIKIKKVLMNQSMILQKVIMTLPYLLSVFGVLMFIKHQWIDYLFLLNEFVFLNHTSGLLQISIEYLGIFILFVLVSYKSFVYFIYKNRRVS